MSYSEIQVVDMRSDTITRPSVKMRQAMADAVVGDDVMGEDPTVNSMLSFMNVMLKKPCSYNYK